MPADLLYTAIGMKGYVPVFSSDRGGVLSLVMDVPGSTVRCPGCKSKDIVRRGSVERKVHAPPIGLRTTVLTIRTPRVQCGACGSVRTIELPKVVPSKNHTKSFARLALDLRKVMTIADVATYQQFPAEPFVRVVRRRVSCLVCFHLRVKGTDSARCGGQPVVFVRLGAGKS